MFAILFWFKVDSLIIMSCYALVMEVLIPSQESEWSCICVLEVSIVTLSIGLNCLDSVVFFVFHFINTLRIFFNTTPLE
jgi:hypothetical protein